MTDCEYYTLLTYLLHYEHLNIRQLEKLLSHFKITYILAQKQNSTAKGYRSFSGMVLLLVCFFFYHRDFFDDIDNKTLSIENLAKRFETLFPYGNVEMKIDDSVDRYIPGYIYDLYAQLLNSYKERLRNFDNLVEMKDNEYHMVFPTTYNKKLLADLLNSTTDYINIERLICMVKMHQYIY